MSNRETASSVCVLGCIRDEIAARESRGDLTVQSDIYKNTVLFILYLMQI